MSIMETPKPVTLDEEIQRLVTLGEKDPLEAARKLEKRYGKDWVLTQLALYAEDILADMIRRRLGSVRRSAELALRPGDPQSQANLRITSAWVPGRGKEEPPYWKPADQLTIEEVRRKARYYEMIAAGSMKRAVWFDAVAALMEAENALTLGDLKAPLPELPGDDVLGLEAA